MRFRLDPGVEAFRAEVRKFLAEEWDGQGDASGPASLAFQSRLAERGWLTLAWPKEYGGAGASHLEQLVYNEEMAYADAPAQNHGVQWVGPTLMLLGTEEQKARFLPPIARAEEHWCTLYSEPEAGSDLASLRTRAVQDGDDFIINGQKIWNGRAHLADWGWLAARTDPSAPKHRGISLFMVDMKSPGISVRPLIDMSGRHHFNEVFFDNVRVPRANLVGELNRGWYHIATALDFERSGVQTYASGRRVVERIADVIREDTTGIRRHYRHEVADRAIEVAVGMNLAYRVALMQAEGKVPNAEASQSRLFGTELLQRIYRTAMRVMGLEGQLRGGSARPGRDFATGYLVSVSETIAGGTAEIQRLIIATRGLGLPRG